MRLQEIKACKLYKVSNRKQAILNSYKVNTSSALKVQDPEDITTPNKEAGNEATEAVNESKSQVSTGVEHRDDGSNPLASPSSHKLDIDLDEEPGNVSEPNFESSVEPSEPKEFTPEVNPSESDTDSNIEESTEVLDKKIEAASGTSLPRTDVTDNMDLEVKDIKGILNAQDTTTGVSRVSVKNDTEVWVHYNDNVNLNDVMIPAIELINQSGYTYMEFNRLARSENAIVFVIIKKDTNRVKKPESEIQQTKE